MISKVKITKSERIILVFIVLLGIFTLGPLLIIKNKCLFVKNYNPDDILFNNRENIAVLNANCGNVIIELYPNISPNAVKRFKTLIRLGAYDNTAFHRVVENKLGTGKSGLGLIKSEINEDFKYKRGSVGLARTFKMDTEDSQFFIILQDEPLFEGEYTPLGKVLYGIEVLEKIKFIPKLHIVPRPDFINSLKLLN